MKIVWLKDSPVRNDTVIKEHATHDLGHFSNDTVLPNDGPLDARALVDLG